MTSSLDVTARRNRLAIQVAEQKVLFLDEKELFILLASVCGHRAVLHLFLFCWPLNKFCLYVHDQQEQISSRSYTGQPVGEFQAHRYVG